MPSSTSIAEKLDGLLAAFNDHDIDRIMSYFAQDCALQLPRGPEPHGLRVEGFDAVKAALNSRLEGIPDIHYRGDGNYVDGNVGISKWLLTGTTTAGQNIAVQGCDFYEFRDGLAIMKDAYWKIVE
ncbi:MAG: nuclear transport factor 2 family protein [Rhodospirillaceae bacterium]|jgi:ketosteroid isomerase-like protein|nr:nuclear transport factor 2 family protein [Rhodospirillaceae bacterium]MBT5193791.1 nuclear transport factor 2 family protein [Rhodospirillaceae bacterium]MBT5894435.1 nuclear transport factor 2 family protein [Rhodospirillaceae bacterium]MBT6430868.1 nuclear transport factor 2 family protein [Rhodospirillaceae bacterium]